MEAKENTSYKGDSANQENLVPEKAETLTARFFRISKVVGSPRLLEGWLDWFRRLNIPCAITRAGKGYSLWRGGQEVGDETDISISLTALREKHIVSSYGL